jgi:hypothetical protein
VSGWVEVLLDRGSLNAGDDALPHGQRWMFPATSTISDLVVWIASHYVPRLPGVHHWELFIDSDDTHAGWISTGSEGWPHWGCPLGILYTHTHDVGPVEELEDRVALYFPGHRQLGGIARSSRLKVTAGHTYGDPVKPIGIGEIHYGSSFEGGSPIRVD